MIPSTFSDPLLDFCMYASYRAQRHLYGISAERLKSWFVDAETFEKLYREEMKRETERKNHLG